MVRPINEGTDIFYVTVENMVDGEGDMPVNPIACELTIRKVKDAWLLSWVDIVEERGRAVEIKSAESGFWYKWHRITSTDGIIYRFDFLTKKLYDKHVKSQVSSHQDFPNDRAVQEYFKHSHGV